MKEAFQSWGTVVIRWKVVVWTVLYGKLSIVSCTQTCARKSIHSRRETRMLTYNTVSKSHWQQTRIESVIRGGLWAGQLYMKSYS